MSGKEEEEKNLKKWIEKLEESELTKEQLRKLPHKLDTTPKWLEEQIKNHEPRPREETEIIFEETLVFEEAKVAQWTCPEKDCLKKIVDINEGRVKSYAKQHYQAKHNKILKDIGETEADTVAEWIRSKTDQEALDNYDKEEIKNANE